MLGANPALTVTFTSDTTPPDTSITANPSDPSKSSSASFSFTGSDPGGSGVASFECQLDGGGYSACSSPKNYTSLSYGSHTFQVRAIDNAGNTDPTPASYTWTIDTSPPDTSITANPPDPSNSSSASFSFTGSDPGGSGVASFECQLDGGGYSACSSPKNYTSLADSSHTFQVRAIDNAGNTDPTPASYTWTIDTSPPDTSITANPPDPSNSSSASFSFTGSDPGGSGVASFECQLDGGGYSACSSPKNYTSLADSSHTFQVRAIDNAGNTDPSPAEYTWEIHAPTSLLYNGQQIVNTDSTLLLGAKLSSSASICKVNQPITFSLDDDPTTTVIDGPFNLGSANTDGSGQAILTVNTSGWQEGVYTITASFAGTTSCDPSSDDVTLTVASPGSAATGGGWYTLSGSGRINFGFTVRKVPNTTNTYKGQMLLHNNGKWRLKGALDTYFELTNKGSASGYGNLYWWDQTLNGGLGGWALSEENVFFTISFVDNTQGGGKKSGDTFGIIINHTIQPGEPSTLPISTPQPLKGGDITIH